jgi:cathepsin F
MKNALIVLVVALFVVNAYANLTSARVEFEKFVKKFEKLYGDVEKEHRFGVFAHNLERIATLNKLDKGATYAVNKFADLTQEEFKNLYLSSQTPQTNFPVAADLPVNDLPTEWDWSAKGAVTPVKNQGQCGSCWAFSTTGNVEGQWFLAGHPLTSFSEQQLVDCDTVDQGCNGGLPSNAYEYIIKAGGIETEDSYPYTAADGQCSFTTAKAVGKVANWTAVSTDEAQIAAFLVAHGPLSIGINAEWMQMYSHGVSDPLFCNPKSLDHGVLITAYGTDSGKDFWTIKNSWGPDWGEKGYYRIVRGKGKCGLNTMVTSASV